MATVVLVGTLDTKGDEYAYLRDRLREHGVDVMLVDAGVVGEPLVEPDVTREEVARGRRRRRRRARRRGRPRRGRRDDGARRRGGREAAPRRGAARRGRRRSAARAARRSSRTRCAQLPVGVPKLMVSTVASGDTRPVRRRGRRDDDVLGRRHRRRSTRSRRGSSPTPRARSAGMAGATRAAARREAAARRRDDVRRHHAVRHRRARASGGARLRGARLPRRPARAAARWRRSSRRGFAVGVARRHDDRVLPTSSSAACSPPGRSGSRRPASAGIPQVVSLGALDMVNFGPLRHRAGALPRPEPLRPQPDDHADADDAGGVRARSGADRRRKLNAADGPDRALRPAARRLRDRDGGPGLPRRRGGRGALRRRCASSSTRPRSRCTRSTPDVNDPAFALAMAEPARTS